MPLWSRSSSVHQYLLSICEGRLDTQNKETQITCDYLRWSHSNMLNEFIIIKQNIWGAVMAEWMRPQTLFWEIHGSDPQYWYDILEEGSCLSGWDQGLQSMSGARKNDVNVTRRFAGNSSFCQVHAFKYGHLLHPITNLSFVCFISRNFIPS